jgi:hypothetical protein
MMSLHFFVLFPYLKLHTNYNGSSHEGNSKAKPQTNQNSQNSQTQSCEEDIYQEIQLAKPG